MMVDCASRDARSLGHFYQRNGLLAALGHHLTRNVGQSPARGRPAAPRHPLLWLLTLHADLDRPSPSLRSEEHTSELQSLMRISYAVFCLKKKKNTYQDKQNQDTS